jgi:hypothetical protein
MQAHAASTLETAPAGGLGSRLALGLRVLFARPELDARLAAGEDPGSDRALSLRGAQLVSQRGRNEVARDLERALSPARRGQSVSAAIPINEEALAAARPAIEQLIAALRSSATAQPQGVALAAQLLTEAAGPLYAPADTGALHRAARTSLLALTRRTEGVLTWT